MNATTESQPTITLDIARHTLFWFGDTNLGIDGGHRINRFFDLLSASDQENIDKAATQWPIETAAWLAVARKPWGLDWLRGIVKDYLDARDFGLDFFEEKP